MLTMSTSGEAGQNEQSTVASSEQAAPSALTGVATRTAVLGRTRLRNATVVETRNLAVPLVRGHSDELHVFVVAEGRMCLPSRIGGEEELHEGDCVIVLGTSSVPVRLVPSAAGKAEIVRITVPELARDAPVPVETGTVIRLFRIQGCSYICQAACW